MLCSTQLVTPFVVIQCLLSESLISVVKVVSEYDLLV